MARSILPRVIGPALSRALEVMPAAVLTGARQAGKSTLARAVGETTARRYLTLDDLGVLDRALRDPEALVRSSADLTLDEVQRAPELLLAVKKSVDGDRRPGRFILTGSANLLLLKSVSESLAGRAAYLTVWPMTRREQLGLGCAGAWSEFLSSPPNRWPGVIAAQVAPSESWRELACRGGYPTAALTLRDDGQRRVWFDGYAATYLERDLRDLASIDRLPEFRRLMVTTCLRLGGVLNRSELARDLGMAQTTVQRYLDLLEISYQLVRVPAFSVNRTKRLIKSPKIYWSDVGLAVHLAGGAQPEGVHLENLVLADLMAWAGAESARPSILHWRTVKGAEVDFVIETARAVLPIEVKASARPTTGDARHLEVFLDEYPKLAAAGLLLHDGEEAFWLTRRVYAVPWWKVI